jgi:assimilatory nitrate reductase catalytic subunit
MSAAQPVRTTCPYCGVGCGVVATANGRGGAAIAGDEVHPANFGKLCVKGTSLGETLDLGGRLLHPMVMGQRASWDRATGHIAEGLTRTIERHGPDSVAFYLSGQMLTEDYYVANKFAKGFLGVRHVDTNSRLCMASSVAGHRRAFGSDTVPNTYADLDAADLIVLVGSNAAWCHPVLFQRMQKARERGALVINIDPRRTATSEGADLQLSVRSGMDSVLFCWLLTQLAAHGPLDQDYIAAHTDGFDAALAAAAAIAPDMETVASRTGLDEADIARFVDLFRARSRVVTCYSQGVNQSAQGADKVNAILNCHLATGRIGKPGAGPLSLTGQPNAMGGREVGGLANMLAAHMNYTPEGIDRVQRFWDAPAMAGAEGLKAVQMFEAIERGEIKALWVMHTNPAVTLPRADAMRAALRKLDLFVVSEAMASTDTSASAHVLLPAAAWGEKDGTVTNSERRISRQRAFLPPPGEAKPDWEHIQLVARRMGHGAAFNHESAAAIFREHASLSAFENDGLRDFDIGAMAAIADEAYAAMQPFHWPMRKGEASQQRFFADGGFYTSDRRARFIAIATPALATQPDEAFPLLLNTGRMRDQWHTMTRSGKAVTLARHASEPMLQVNPLDAAALGLEAGAYARVDSRHGQATLRVALDEGLPRGSVFAPFHWNDATAGLARVDAVAQPCVDPVSGQPELKATPVRITPMAMACQGFIVTRMRLEVPSWLQHARLPVAGGEAIVFASVRPAHAVHGLLANLLPQGHRLALMHDPASEDYRAMAFEDERLTVALLTSNRRDEAAFDRVTQALEQPRLSPAERKSLLAGRLAAGGADAGPTICACFAVRRTTIEAAIAAGAMDLDAVAAATRAGSNCGSCRPEIKRVINDACSRAKQQVAA